MSSDTQFKVFRRGEERKAFRLERIFWDLLEQTANAKGITLRDFVFTIVDSEPDGTNLTSSLRTVAASWAREKLAAADKNNPRDHGMEIFHACPAPGIVIAENRRIVAYNKAMVTFLQDHNSALEGSEISNVRFAFDLPIGRIVAFLVDAPGKFIECGFRLAVGDENVTGRARVWLSWDAEKQERHLGAFVSGRDR